MWILVKMGCCVEECTTKVGHRSILIVLNKMRTAYDKSFLAIRAFAEQRYEKVVTD